ncbi:unnamed protein product [Closterium sp. Naga37s-1]|nr:unnamed protein product [Closterium sp. Naga37s-1]
MGGITRKIKRSKTEEVAAVDRALLRRDGDRAITNAMIFGGCIKVETLMDLEGLRDAVILSRVAEMEGGASAKSVSIVPATQLPPGSELVAGWAGKLRWGVMHNKDKGVWEMVLYIGPKPFLRGRTQLGVMQNKGKGVWEVVLCMGPSAGGKTFESTQKASSRFNRSDAQQGQGRVGDGALHGMAYKFRGTSAVLNFGLSAAEKLELEQMTKDDFHLHLSCHSSPPVFLRAPPPPFLRFFLRMAYKFRGTSAVLNFGLSAAEKLELEQMTKDDFHLHLRKTFVRSFRSRSCPSIYKGVKWGPQEQKWIAAIRVGNRFSKIGLYDAEEEAAAAYDRTIVEVRGVHVMTNAKFVDGLNHAQVTVTEIPIKGQEEAFIRAAGGGIGGDAGRGAGRGGRGRGRGRGRPPITHLAREERRNRLVASLGGSVEAAKLGISGGDGTGAAGDGAGGAAAELGAGAAEGEGGGGEGEGGGAAAGDASNGGGKEEGKEEWVPAPRAEELEQIEEWMANEWEQGEIVGWMEGVVPGGDEKGLSTLVPAGAAGGAGGGPSGNGEGGGKGKGEGEEEGSLAIDLEMAGLDDGDDAAGGGEGGGDAEGDWDEFCETTAREVAEGAGNADGEGASGDGGAGKKGAGGKGGEVGADELGNAHASVEQLLAAAEAGPGAGAGAAGGSAGGAGEGEGEGEEDEDDDVMLELNADEEGNEGGESGGNGGSGEGAGGAPGRDWMDTVEGDDDKTEGGEGEGGGGDGSKTPAKGPGQEGDAGAITPSQGPSRLPLTPGSAPSALQISTVSTLAAPTSSFGAPDSSGLQTYSGKRPRGRPRIHEHPEEEKNRLSEKYMGVEFKGRTRAWEAFLMSGQRRYNYGQRYTEKEAARLHDKVAYRLKGPTAPTNYPLGEEDKARLDSMTVEEFLTHVRRTNVSSVFQGRRGSSLFKGVSWMPDKQQWAALIKLDHGKVRKIGLYTTEEDAAAAYDRALIDRDGPEALTNERFFRSLDDDALDRLLQSRRSRDESCNWKERAKYFLDNIDKLGHKSKRARAPSPVGARGLVGGGGAGPVGSREGEEGPQAGTVAALGGGAISSQKVSQSAAAGRKGRGGGAAGGGRYGSGGMGSGGYGYMGGGMMGGGSGVMGMGGYMGSGVMGGNVMGANVMGANVMGASVMGSGGGYGLDRWGLYPSPMAASGHLAPNQRGMPSFNPGGGGFAGSGGGRKGGAVGSGAAGFKRGRYDFEDEEDFDEDDEGFGEGFDEEGRGVGGGVGRGGWGGGGGWKRQQQDQLYGGGMGGVMRSGGMGSGAVGMDGSSLYGSGSRAAAGGGGVGGGAMGKRSQPHTASPAEEILRMYSVGQSAPGAGGPSPGTDKTGAGRAAQRLPRDVAGEEDEVEEEDMVGGGEEEEEEAEEARGGGSSPPAPMSPSANYLPLIPICLFPHNLLCPPSVP